MRDDHHEQISGRQSDPVHQFIPGDEVVLKGSAFYYDAAVGAAMRIHPEERRAVVVAQLHKRGRVTVEFQDGSQQRVHERYLAKVPESEQ